MDSSCFRVLDSGVISDGVMRQCELENVAVYRETVSLLKSGTVKQDSNDQLLLQKQKQLNRPREFDNLVISLSRDIHLTLQPGLDQTVLGVHLQHFPSLTSLFPFLGMDCPRIFTTSPPTPTATWITPPHTLIP